MRAIFDKPGIYLVVENWGRDKQFHKILCWRSFGSVVQPELLGESKTLTIDGLQEARAGAQKLRADWMALKIRFNPGYEDPRPWFMDEYYD